MIVCSPAAPVSPTTSPIRRSRRARARNNLGGSDAVLNPVENPMVIDDGPPIRTLGDDEDAVGQEDSTIDMAQEVIRALGREEIMVFKNEYDGESEISLKDDDSHRITIRVPPRPPRVKPDPSESTAWHTLSSPFKNPIPIRRSIYDSNSAVIRQAPPVAYSQIPARLPCKACAGSREPCHFLLRSRKTDPCWNCKSNNQKCERPPEDPVHSLFSTEERRDSISYSVKRRRMASMNVTSSSTLQRPSSPIDVDMLDAPNTISDHPPPLSSSSASSSSTKPTLSSDNAPNGPLSVPRPPEAPSSLARDPRRDVPGLYSSSCAPPPTTSPFVHSQYPQPLLPSQPVAPPPFHTHIDDPSSHQMDTSQSQIPDPRTPPTPQPTAHIPPPEPVPPLVALAPPPPNTGFFAFNSEAAWRASTIADRRHAANMVQIYKELTVSWMERVEHFDAVLKSHPAAAGDGNNGNNGTANN
ncbi:hypothetical protein SISSUDRAFT_1038339 [Sistotremastrum suecicum HHB10207 ss-3]|uniref:Zn(2)-C6 fungal-type domain-containing protein n=1 Tax=Sistotremastrum suecicum HHB10207 ss-3 TaxID=1314776 RepID=A0A165WWB2_9AGAM|nr:hypothetical protein SISSUDRAFT_1038339 [Sistotremastrum suecicum HHB10207 ss-3]